MGRRPPRDLGTAAGEYQFAWNGRVFARVLLRMREAVRKRSYVMTLHAEEEMDADGLSIYDVENVILSGKIVERQTERATREPKYLVRGGPLEGDESVVVATKVGPRASRCS